MVAVSVTTVGTHCTRRLYAVDLATAFTAIASPPLEILSKLPLFTSMQHLLGTDARAPLTSHDLHRASIGDSSLGSAGGCTVISRQTEFSLESMQYNLKLLYITNIFRYISLLLWRNYHIYLELYVCNMCGNLNRELWILRIINLNMMDNKLKSYDMRT